MGWGTGRWFVQRESGGGGWGVGGVGGWGERRVREKGDTLAVFVLLLYAGKLI